MSKLYPPCLWLHHSSRVNYIYYLHYVHNVITLYYANNVNDLSY